MSSYFRDGACPQVAMKENIEFARLSGDWYIHADTCPMSRVVHLDCNHAVIQANADGSFNVAKEMSIDGHAIRIKGIKGIFTGNTLAIDMFGEKVNLEMNLLDTDFDNWAIFYQCFDNISVVQADNTVKPVHAQLVALAGRNANLSDAEYETLMQRALTVLQEETADNFNRLKSGDAAQCEYSLKMSDL